MAQDADLKILYSYNDAEDHPTGRFQRAGVRRFARQMGWTVLFEKTGCDLEDIRRAVRRSKPDGLIIEASFCPEGFAPSSFGRLPTVYLDCSVDAYEGRIWKVVYDSEAIGRRGAKELMKVSPAASCYAYVGYREKVRWSTLREEGFREEIDGAGLRSKVIACRKGESASAYRIRLKRWLAALPTKVGLMASNDEMAFWTLEILTELGRRVPADIVVLGVDNDEEFCSQCSPSITSLRMDNDRAGYAAADLLNVLMQHGKRREKTVRIDRCSVVSRRSTGSMGRGVEAVVAASDYIREHAGWGITARDVIGRMKLSPRMAEIRYRQMTGRSIAADIQLVRFEQLFALLRNGRRNLSILADMCGFGNSETLRREFRRRTGMSVRDWCRRNHGVLNIM